jgi:uncharacterized membrane protein YadS
MTTTMKMKKILMAAPVLLAVLKSAWAAEGEGTAPPPIESSTPWMAILYSLVAAAAICILGFKNSHRTHLD